MLNHLYATPTYIRERKKGDINIEKPCFLLHMRSYWLTPKLESYDWSSNVQMVLDATLAVNIGCYITLHQLVFFCYVLFIIVINVIRNHGNNARKLKVEVLIERVNELSWYGRSGHCFLPEPQLCWLTIHLHTCNKNDLFSYSISRATLRLLHFKDIRTGVEWMIIHFVGIKGEINSGVEQTQTKVKLVIVWTNKQEINVITNRKITTLLKSVCCDE